MKQNQSDFSFLSCTEIFCEPPLIESKQHQQQQQNTKQNFYHQQQMYPKLLQVKSQIDTTLVQDDRVMLNLIKAEQRYFR